MEEIERNVWFAIRSDSETYGIRTVGTTCSSTNQMNGANWIFTASPPGTFALG